MRVETRVTKLELAAEAESEALDRMIEAEIARVGEEAAAEVINEVLREFGLDVEGGDG